MKKMTQCLSLKLFVSGSLIFSGIFSGILSGVVLSGEYASAEPGVPQGPGGTAPGSNKVGRLNDGRAYRMDADGNQLVDRIAELEVTVNDLKRELGSLEDEVEAKQSVIDRLSPGGSGKVPVRETALGPPQKPKREKSERKKVSTKESPGNAVPNCNELVSNLVLQVSRLENQLRAQAPATGAVASLNAPRAECDYQSPANPLWEQVTRLQDALMKAPSEQAIGREREQNKELATGIEQGKRALEEKEEKLAKLESSLGEANQKISLLEKELEAKGSVQTVSARAEVPYRTPPQTARDEEEARRRARLSDSPRETPAPAMTADVREARAELTRSLKKINTLISNRKDLLDKLRRKSSSVSLSVQPLVSKKGNSLDSLRSGVARLGSTEEASAIDTELADVTKLLEEDIKTLRRLLKI